MMSDPEVPNDLLAPTMPRRVTILAGGWTRYVRSGAVQDVSLSIEPHLGACSS